MSTRWDLVKMQNMTWLEYAKKKDSVLILPIGSTEQHGPHLPLNVDCIIAEHFAWRVAEKLDAIVAPVLSYGYKSKPLSGGGPLFPGTIDLSGNTLQLLIQELLEEFYKDGFRKVFIMNAHFENEPFIVEAMDITSQKLGDDFTSLTSNWWDPMPDALLPVIFDEVPFPGWALEHAAITETSLMLYFSPEYVNMNYIVDTKGTTTCSYIKYPIDKNMIPSTGVLSTAHSSSYSKGELIATTVIDKLVEIIKSNE